MGNCSCSSAGRAVEIRIRIIIIALLLQLIRPFFFSKAKLSCEITTYQVLMTDVRSAIVKKQKIVLLFATLLQEKDSQTLDGVMNG